MKKFFSYLAVIACTFGVSILLDLGNIHVWRSLVFAIFVAMMIWAAETIQKKSREKKKVQHRNGVR